VVCFFPETTGVGVSQPSAKEKVVLSSGCKSSTKQPETIYLSYFTCKRIELLHDLQGAGIIMCLLDMTCTGLSEAESTLHTAVCSLLSLLIHAKTVRSSSVSSTQISCCCKHCLQRNAQSLPFETCSKLILPRLVAVLMQRSPNSMLLCVTQVVRLATTLEPFDLNVSKSALRALLEQTNKY